MFSAVLCTLIAKDIPGIFRWEFLPFHCTIVTYFFPTWVSNDVENISCSVMLLFFTVGATEAMLC